MAANGNNNWKPEKLEDICAQITDGKHGDCQDDPNSGFYFLSCKDVANGKLNYEGARQITEADFLDTHRRTKFAPTDVLITNSGTIGRMAIAPDNELTRRTTFQKSVAILKPIASRVEPNFLYYALQGDIHRLIEFAGGTAQKNLLLRDLRAFEVSVPPLPVQRRIAGILSAYDELMENSQRRIRLLEAMARALYREWFVHFRFPGHEKHPRVASPLGDIPQGWEVLPISTIANIVLGGTPSRSINEYWYGGTIPWLKSGKLNDLRVIEGSELITARGFEMSATKLMPPKTVLVAITGAILISFLEIEACANQSVIGIYETKKVCPEYLHIYLSENISLFESKMSGSAQQHINKDIVEQTLVLVPHEKPGYAFRLFVQPLYEEIALLLFKIQNLRRTRDLLLPRLLSGQVHQIKTEP